jgi:hypothetical protein
VYAVDVPLFVYNMEIVPLCVTLWILNDLLYTYGPVLSPSYEIFSTRQKVVHCRLAPEKADLFLFYLGHVPSQNVS